MSSPMEMELLGVQSSSNSDSSNNQEANVPEGAEEHVDVSSSEDEEGKGRRKRDKGAGKKQKKQKKQLSSGTSEEEDDDVDEEDKEGNGRFELVDSDGDLENGGGNDDRDEEKADKELQDRLQKMGKLKGSVIAMHKPTMTANLEWHNINYSLKLSLPPQQWWKKLLNKIPFMHHLLNKTMKRQILTDVTGKVKAGEFLAILGPTGSGKTTLLNILAGRVKSRVKGEILLNGQEPTRQLRRQTAYVLQDDIFFTNLTVKETLRYSAYLKLPRALSWKQKRQRVDDVIQELNIAKCADTVIGGPFARGVSGGERKRTNIGNELLSNPALILLDEPTSGLDSSTALSLIITLKELAKSGRTVVTTIHQPSSAMFQMFDNVLLLADGKIAYYGKASKVVPYFSSLGYQCTPHYNPADYMLELVTSDVMTEDGRAVKEVLTDSYAERVQKNQTTSETRLDKNNDNNKKKKRKGPKFPTRFLPQLLVLMMRSFKQKRGDSITGLSLVQTLLISIIAGVLWWQIDYNEEAIKDRNGFIFFACVYWMLNPWFGALYSFPPERAVLNKERQSGSYRLSAYFLAKTFSETPLDLILPFIFVTITYWMVGLNVTFQNYLIFLLIIFLCTMLGTSIGLAIGATVLNTQKAVTFSAVAVLSLMLLGGFYIQQDNMPVWIRWAQWISPLRYVYDALLINEYDVTNDKDWTPSTPSTYTVNPIRGSDIIDEMAVKTKIWYDIIIIVAMLVVARFFAYLALRFMNKPKK